MLLLIPDIWILPKFSPLLKQKLLSASAAAIIISTKNYDRMISYDRAFLNWRIFAQTAPWHRGHGATVPMYARKSWFSHSHGAHIHIHWFHGAMDIHRQSQGAMTKSTLSCPCRHRGTVCGAIIIIKNLILKTIYLLKAFFWGDF